MRYLCAVVAALVFGAYGDAPLRAQSPPARPNVVLIMSDDMGYGDLSSYGATDIRTPNIDSIGRDGVRLTDFYANGVLCSPTRAALMSGRYPQRYFIEVALGGEGTRGLKGTPDSLPQVLKTNGYATALVGKWHLGGTAETSPKAHGFDYFFGLIGSHVDYYHHNRGPKQDDLWENESKIRQEGYMTDLITDRSIRFIEQSAGEGRPFFVDVAYNAPHWPYQPPGKPSPPPGTGRQQLPQEDNTATRADYAAMVEAVDKGVGQILGTLDRLGLANNTIVIFTNDNGGEWLSDNRPLFNRKLTTWEGGIRVPALVRWPGRIPTGRVSDQVGITMDLSASIVAASGGMVPAQYEGMNLFPILEGRAPEVERTLYWRATAVNRNQRAVRSGDWKVMVDTGHVMVFDLRRDIGERNDLAYQRPDIARRLRPLLTRWEEQIDAEALVHEPQLAAAAQAAGRGGRGGAAGRAGGDGRETGAGQGGAGERSGGAPAQGSTPQGGRGSARYPAPVEGDFVLKDFRFRSGEVLPELKLHYRTIGKPARDAKGIVRNAVLVLHGTGGTGAQFLRAEFAGELFAAGALFDGERHFIILPDGIGHGGSSKPSGGLRARFPRYGYLDMVEAQYRLLTDGLGVNHLRLVMGTSMGGMHTWLWGQRHPDFMDALMPLASLPTQISGRNRVWRRVAIDAIRHDPEWRGGNYTTQPPSLRTAEQMLFLVGSNPTLRQAQMPTLEKSDATLDASVAASMKTDDANDVLYQLEASRDYDPGPGLEKIRAPLVAVNSADDLINPPELGILEREIKRVPRGRAVVVPFGPETRGHGTHTIAAVWKQYLEELLKSSTR